MKSTARNWPTKSTARRWDAVDAKALARPLRRPARHRLGPATTRVSSWRSRLRRSTGALQTGEGLGWSPTASRSSRRRCQRGGRPHASSTRPRAGCFCPGRCRRGKARCPGALRDPEVLVVAEAGQGEVAEVHAGSIGDWGAGPRGWVDCVGLGLPLPCPSPCDGRGGASGVAG